MMGRSPKRRAAPKGGRNVKGESDPATISAIVRAASGGTFESAWGWEEEGGMGREYVLYGIMGLLLLLAAILFVRLCQFKRQMRLFAARLRRRKEQDVNQVVTVEYFDRDVEGLAVALNEYTDVLKERLSGLEGDRQHLKNVIAGISHDFRTPLTAAKGYLQLIQKSGRLDEKNREYLDIAMDKTDYLKVLSDAFFEVSSLEAGEDAEPEAVNLTKLLSELCLGQYQWIRERGIRAAFDIPEQDVIVRSNAVMLNRILGNFFSNARKYSASYLKVTLAGEGDAVLVCVENDVEPGRNTDVTRVFEAFYRDAPRHQEGAGLGLYVVKRLAGRLGHRVWAEAGEDSFRVCLQVRAEGG